MAKTATALGGGGAGTGGVGEVVRSELQEIQMQMNSTTDEVSVSGVMNLYVSQ